MKQLPDLKGHDYKSQVTTPVTYPGWVTLSQGTAGVPEMRCSQSGYHNADHRVTLSQNGLG